MRKTRTNALKTTAIVAPAIALGAVIALLVGSSSASAGAQVISVLASDQDDSATLAAGIDLEQVGDGGVAGNVIDLGTDDHANYWTAEDKAGNVCVITNPVGTDAYGSACGDPSVVESSGIFVTVESGSESPDNYYVEAYLVPDSTVFDDETLASVSLERVSENVVARTEKTATAEADSVADGSGFELNLATSVQ